MRTRKTLRIVRLVVLASEPSGCFVRSTRPSCENTLRIMTASFDGRFSARETTDGYSRFVFGSNLR